jgi:uncharacterized protein (TIGR02594 family)
MDLIKIGLQEYGQKDILGISNNPQILKYFKDIGQKLITNDDTPWCAAFTNWVLLKAGKIGTGSLSARSFLKYGISTKEPKLGDIVVLWRISPDNEYGHVGFFIKQTDNNIFILGGNQNDEVNISKFSKSQLLDFRKIPLANQSYPIH